MKKFFSFLLITAFVVTAFSGCAKQKLPSETDGSAGFEPALDTAATAEIIVNGSWSNFEALEAVAADWNKVYPGVAVNYSKIDDFVHNAHLLVKSADAPDIVLVNRDTFLANKEELLDALTDLSKIGLNTEIINKNFIEAGTYKDKLCVFNWGMLANGFVVNKTILDKLKIDIPKTAAEFEKACNTLKMNGYTPIQGSAKDLYGNLLKNDRDYRISIYDDQEGLYNSFKNAVPGCAKFFDAEFGEMLNMIKRGYTDTEINNGISNPYEDNIMNFLKGSTPFLCFSTESFSGIKKRESKSQLFNAEPFEYEFVSIPIILDETVVSVSPVNGFGIVSGSKNEEWAKEFMRFLCRESELNKIAYVKGVPSVTQKGSNDERYTNILNIPQKRWVAVSENKTVRLIDGCFGETLSAIASGEVKTVEEAEQYFEEKLPAWIDLVSKEE